MRRRLTLAATLAILGAIPACSSSNPDSPSSNAPASTITTAETASLESSIATAGGTINDALFNTVASMSGSGTTQLNTTQACPAGGTATGTGPVVVVVNNGGTGGSISPDVKLSYSKCVVGQLTLDGGPVEIKGSLVVTNSTIQNPVTFTINGSHNFTVDGSTGLVSFSCSNSLTIDSSLNPISLVSNGNASIQYPTGHKSTNVACQDFANSFGFTSSAAALISRVR